MLIFVRLVAALLAFWAIERAQNYFLVGLYVCLSVIFQTFLTVCKRIAKSYKLDREVLHILRSSNTWFTARALATQIAKKRLDRELESGKLEWKGYRKRESYLLNYELNPQMLMTSLMSLLNAGEVEHFGSATTHPVHHQWRRAQCSPTRGPWGWRNVREEPEGG